MERVEALNKILRQPNLIEMVARLKRLLASLDEDRVVSLLRSKAGSERLIYILEAAAASGTLAVYRAVLRFLPPDAKLVRHLGRFDAKLLLRKAST